MYLFPELALDSLIHGKLSGPLLPISTLSPLITHTKTKVTVSLNLSYEFLLLLVLFPCHSKTHLS
jgi:hypothetical protein